MFVTIGRIMIHEPTFPRGLTCLFIFRCTLLNTACEDDFLKIIFIYENIFFLNYRIFFLNFMNLVGKPDYKFRIPTKARICTVKI